MFRAVKDITICVRDVDEAVKTYTEVLGLAKPVVPGVEFSVLRYRRQTLRIGDITLQLVQPWNDPEGKSVFSRFIQTRGEGTYLVTVAVDNPEQYARGLEAKGVRVIREAVDSGRPVGGAPRPPSSATRLMIHPRYTHGVLWRVGRPDPTPTPALPNNAFNRVRTLIIACRDIEATVKTYMDVLGFAEPTRTTNFPNRRESVLHVGDVRLEIIQPWNDPDGPIARFLQRRGEGLYLIHVDMADPVAYAKGLEAKGVSVHWEAARPGVDVAGIEMSQRSQRPPSPEPRVNAMIPPGAAHGVLWYLDAIR